GDDHDRQNEPGSKDAYAERRAAEYLTEHGHPVEEIDDVRLHILLEQRHEYEQPPHAVDDGGNGRQHLDGSTQWPAQPDGRQLGEEHGDAKRSEERRVGTEWRKRSAP